METAKNLSFRLNSLLIIIVLLIGGYQIYNAVQESNKMSRSRYIDIDNNLYHPNSAKGREIKYEIEKTRNIGIGGGIGCMILGSVGTYFGPIGTAIGVVTGSYIGREVGERITSKPTGQITIR